MTKYFAGNSLAAFSRTSIGVQETTTAGTFDPDYVANGIFIPVPGTLNGDYLKSYDFLANPDELWVRFDYQASNTSSTTSTAIMMGVYNGPTCIFRIRGSTTSSNNCSMEYWNGAAFVATGGSFTQLTSRQTYAVKIDLKNGGFEVYRAGVLVASGSGWTGFSTSVTNVSFGSWYNNGSAVVSQVMVADYDIRDSHFMAPAISGNSAVNTGQLSGSYTDVNEVPTNDANAILINTVGNKAGQTKAAITVPVGFGISAGVINGRGRVSGGVVTDGKLGWRSGGANYSSTALGYDGGYGPRGVISEANPATAGAWNQTSFNAAEIYEEAA